MNARPRFERVAIAGLGLLGGSLARALRRRGLARRLAAWGPDLADLRRARAAGVVDEVDNGARCAQGADLVLVCTPFTATEAVLKEAARWAPKGCLAADVGSVKGPLAGRWTRAAGPMRFVPCHPMAGGERKGWRNASAERFEGAACLMTPVAATHRRALAEMGALWRSLGARVAVMDPLTHDRLVARISHLPHATAAALSAAQSRAGAVSDFSWAGAGWRDTSRVAGSDPELWADILLHQARPLERHLRGLEIELARLRRLLAAGSRPAVTAWLQRAAEFRASSVAGR